MPTTVIGIFDDPQAARRALEHLRDSTVQFDDISIISRDTTSGEAVSDDDRLGAGGGAALGAVWGGVVGGLAALAIPGIGPFVAGGAIAAAITGAATGAVIGGVAGALMSNVGISEDEARQYEQLVHEGRTLVAIRTTKDDEALFARQVLVSYGADETHDGRSDADTTLGPVGGAGRHAAPGPISTGASMHPQTGAGTRSPMVQVAMYDESGQRVDNLDDPYATRRMDQPAAREAGTTENRHWTAGQWVGEGQGRGPHETGVHDVDQWTGEGQEPGVTSGDTWTGGEWVGEGQGEGPHDTGTFDSRQWVGEGQGRKPKHPDDAPPRKRD